MKSLSPALQAHLDSGATTLAWCWRIERTDGVVFGFTDHDRELVFGGVTFEPDSGFAASEIRSGTDLAVDAQDAEGVLTSDIITETDILDGRWDNAAVELWRVNWDAVAQRVLMRRGAIGQVRRGRLAFVAEVRSLAHVLNQTVGRTFQHACDAELGDARCGVDLDDPAFRATGSATAVSGDRSFAASGLSGFAAGWFTLGRLTWTSGPNAGRVAEVASHDVVAGTRRLTLLEAPVRPIAAGHDFVVRAGCDKRLETCRDRFANVVNFRGFPHIPGQDTVVRYPTRPFLKRIIAVMPPRHGADHQPTASSRRCCRVCRRGKAAGTPPTSASAGRGARLPKRATAAMALSGVAITICAALRLEEPMEVASLPTEPPAATAQEQAWDGDLC